MAARSQPSRRSTRSSSRRRAPHRWAALRRVRVLVPAVVGLGLVMAIGLLALDAFRAQQSLTRATEQAEQLQGALTAGDPDEAERVLDRLQASARSARDHTDGPLWGAAARVPVLGRSVDAVRVASTTLDDIARRALPPIVGTSATLDSTLFRPTDGTFPVEKFAELTEPVATAATVLRENRRRVDALDPDDVLGLLAGSVADLQEKVGTAEEAASAAARALEVAPILLGAEREQTYLLLFQNNAESRSTGGIASAFAVVRAKNGRLSFDEQPTTAELRAPDDDPVVKLSEDERRTFGSALGFNPADITATPDFPRTAEIARRLLERSTGIRADGVVSVDPVALSYLLEGTGPVAVPGAGDLTSDNAVRRLLSDVYADFPDPLQQDAFFAAAAQAVFKTALSGEGDPTKILSGITKAERERRVMLWSNNDTVEEEIQGTRLAGALPATTSTPRVGVYLNETNSSKMQYYLGWNTTVTSTSCSQDGVQRLTSTTVLRSDTPADLGKLPDGVVEQNDEIKRGAQRVTLLVVAPAGGTVQSAEADEEPIPLLAGQVEDRPVAIMPMEIGPGEEVQVSVRMTSGKDQRGRTVVTTTPGVKPFGQDVRFSSSCRS